MNGQGLGGVGFSGGIGQPGATGMGPGGMGGGFSGGILGGGMSPDLMLELMGFKKTATNPIYPMQQFSRAFGLAPTPGQIQTEFMRQLAQRSGMGQPQQQAAAPAPAQMVRQAPQAAPTAPLAPVTPQSPYAGILGQQGAQAGYGGMLSRMMASPNRQMLRRPGIA